MRNLNEYPITTDEIVEFLTDWATGIKVNLEQNPDAPVGDLSLVILQEAVARMRVLDEYRLLLIATPEDLATLQPKQKKKMEDFQKAVRAMDRRNLKGGFKRNVN